MFTDTFVASVFVFSFYQKICFYHFHFSHEISNFCNKININQSETVTGDKKLSV